MAGQLDLGLGLRRVALTVSRLVRSVRETLEESFDDCWVTGEISNARAANSNHLYFTLKDPGAAINVVMFSSAARRLRFKLVDGMKVVVRGRVNVYEPRGNLQFYAEEMEPRGVGALQIAFEQLKRKLSAEGLFNPERKRELPFLPVSVGIVTAIGGAGLRDILRVLLDRFPNLHIVIRPARVQGDGAAFEIAQAVEDLNRHGRAEVIIVGRGGGSTEDLWAFNEEIVARAIFRSEIPIVSAVGHEIDFTIADFVADKRAPTPTFAAQMVVPAREELRERIRVVERALNVAMRKQLNDLAQKTDHLGARVKHPRALLRGSRERLGLASAELAYSIAAQSADARRRVSELSARLRAPTAAVRETRIRTRELAGQLGHAIRTRAASLRAVKDQFSTRLFQSESAALENQRRRLAASAAQLDSISPLRCLERGYAVVVSLRDGRTVLDSRKVEIGDLLDIRLRRGKIRARTEEREN